MITYKLKHFGLYEKVPYEFTIKLPKNGFFTKVNSPMYEVEGYSSYLYVTEEKVNVRERYFITKEIIGDKYTYLFFPVVKFSKEPELLSIEEFNTKINWDEEYYGFLSTKLKEELFKETDSEKFILILESFKKDISYFDGIAKIKGFSGDGDNLYITFFEVVKNNIINMDIPHTSILEKSKVQKLIKEEATPIINFIIGNIISEFKYC
jgi:hypothetical protein